MRIDFAVESDYTYILERDKHIHKSLIEAKIKGEEILILRKSNQGIGWLRYSYFWDNTPFMNMLWIDEPFRGIGIGKNVVLYWEQLMRDRKFGIVMTSTQSNEEAQHFYRKLGYKDAGCFIQENEPLEILLTKKL